MSFFFQALLVTAYTVWEARNFSVSTYYSSSSSYLVFRSITLAVLYEFLKSILVVHEYSSSDMYFVSTCRHGDTKICWKLGARIQRYGRRSRQRGSAPSVEYEIPETNTLRPPTGKYIGPINMTTSVIIFACEAELFLNMSRGSPVEGRIVKLPGHKNVLTEFQYS